MPFLMMWLNSVLGAAFLTVPNQGEQMVRYYGWYSNVSRGKRQKLGEDGAIPHIIESDNPSAVSRKSWARLIQKHLDLWLIRSRPPVKAHAPPAREYASDGFCHSAFPDDAVYGDPDYSWDAYITT